jgi:tetratricopeptide (TPR) repeat protein
VSEVVKSERKKVIILTAVAVFICLVILQVIFAVRAGKGITVKPDVYMGYKGNINLESELKKTEILIKMGFENAYIYYNRGWIYAQKGQYDLAKNILRQFLTLQRPLNQTQRCPMRFVIGEMHICRQVK